MSDDWKYRDLPRAANGIAPAQWNPDTKQYEVYEGDRRIIDKLERIERRLNEPIDAQLTGSRVEDVVLVNSYAINNTSYHDFKVENSHKYRKILVKYRSTLDKDIRLYVREAPGQPFWRILVDNSYRSYWGVLKPNGASIDIVNDSIVQLDELVGESFVFTFRAEEAPTEGSLSVWVTGVIN